MARGCLTIDDAASGGSDAGAWVTHIAHTPSLRTQCPDLFSGARPSGRNESKRADGPASLTEGAGPSSSEADTS
jgi:hypothetical protein